MRWLAIAAPLVLGGCASIPVSVAVSAGISLFGIANQDALTFLKVTDAPKACPAPAAAPAPSPVPTS